jgi:hypothetical protein
LEAQNPRIYPALFWGDHQWVSIKLLNQSSNSKTVRVDVYRKSGEQISLKPVYEIGPERSVEVRLDNQAMPELGTEQWGWARVEELDSASDGLVVKTSIEILRGDELSTFAVTPYAEQSPGNKWEQRTTLASNRNFYVLNTSGEAVSLAICVTNDDGFAACGNKDRVLLRREMPAHATVVMRFGKLPRKYLAIDMMPASSAILGFLSPQKGDKHKFSSDSSVVFAEDK